MARRRGWPAAARHGEPCRSVSTAARIAGMTAYETILQSRPAEHVVLITLNRPHAANAFNTRMAEELGAALYALAGGEDGAEQDADDSRELRELRDTRCVVLTGAGNRAFSAGADLKERDGMSDAAWL